MHSYTVTIGRNVGDIPMPTQRWEEFKREAAHALDAFGSGSDMAESHEGFGVWGETPEVSFKRTLLTDTPLGDYLMHDLKSSLSRIARKYNQDAIALTTGASECIAAYEGVTA